jgi:hypothetical protein
MEITKELHTLATFTAGPLPVISVYLDTQWRDPHQRARTTTFFERHLHQADGFVELIAPDRRLAAYEGVGALLRYQ